MAGQSGACGAAAFIERKFSPPLKRSTPPLDITPSPITNTTPRRREGQRTRDSLCSGKGPRGRRFPTHCSGRAPNAVKLGKSVLSESVHLISDVRTASGRRRDDSLDASGRMGLLVSSPAVCEPTAREERPGWLGSLGLPMLTRTARRGRSLQRRSPRWPVAAVRCSPVAG